MSTKDILKNKILYEFKQIEKEFEFLDLIIKKSDSIGIDEIELRASATSLQSIYNGFEKILIIIFKTYNLQIPNNHAWHSELLKLSIENNIISEKLESLLRDYMGFRHFVRHAYSFMLDTELVKPLLFKLSDTINLMKNEINNYIK